jgi:riboflavin biosynthesis pyrimidine reductase
LTTESGLNSLKSRIDAAGTSSRWETLEIIKLPSIENMIDLTKLMSHLSTNLGIKYLDVSCGGSVIQKLRDLKLLDEIRYTISGQVCGGANEAGIERPTAFPNGGNSYSEANSVLIRWIGIPRVLGDRLIFIRGAYEYRH